MKQLQYAKVAVDELHKEEAEKRQKRFEDIATYKGSDAGKDIGEGFVDVLSSLKGGDLMGMGKGLASAFGASMKGAAGRITRKGVEAGAAGKDVGLLMKGLQPIVNMIAKIGPLLSIAGASIAGLIKLFLDADSMVKDFQKDLLSSASTAETLYRNSLSVNTAMSDMQDTLKGIRKAAYSLESIQFGISPQDAAAVVNTLTAEGVAIDRIRTEAKAANQDVQSFTQNLLEVSVAYSRNFGVSLSEITQLQSEMMTELGANFKDVQLSFHMMEKNAVESGIATNKFFSMIRGVSADLSLYNTRLEDAVHLLGQLGKVMSPRNAEKFLHTSMSVIKNMGRTQRLQTALLAGGGGGKGVGKAKAVVDRDVDRSAKALSDKIAGALGGSAGDYEDAVKKGGKGFMDLLAKLPKQMQGEIREAQIELQLKTKLGAGGTYGVGIASGEVSAAGQLQIIADALKNFNGGKSIADGIASIGEQAMAENLGISIEDLKANAKLEIAMKDQRDSLMEELQAGGDRQAKALEKLRKANIKIGKSDKETAKNIDQAGYDQIMDTMDESAVDAAKGSKEEINWGKRQAELTVSLSQKLEQLVGFIMNQFYDAVIGIWDTISDLLGDDRKKQGRKVEEKLARAGNDELMKTFRDVGGDIDKFRGSVIMHTDAGKQLGEALMKAPKENAKYIDAGIKDLAKNRWVGGDEKLAAVFKDAGINDDDKLTKFTKAMAVQGKSTVDAASDAGLTQEELGRLLAKAQWQIPADAFADATTQFAKSIGPGGQQPAQTATAPAAAAPPPAPAAPPQPAPVAAAPPPPPPPPAPVQPPGPKQAPVSSDTVEATADAQMKHQADVADDQARKMKTPSWGVVLNGPFLANKFGSQMEESVYKGTSQALLEYFLYSSLKQQDVAMAIGRGADPKQFSKQFANAMVQTGGVPQAAIDKVAPMAANARGGTVMQPAPGEVMASVKPGENIVPAGKGGGGGTVVELRLKGDLARWVDARVVDGVAKFETNKRK